MKTSWERATRVWSAMALLVGLTGCAGMQFPRTPDRFLVSASDAARECRTPSEKASSADASPKLERTARAALGAVKGALVGAGAGAGIGLFFALAYPAGCVEPTACGAYVGTMVTGSAIGFAVIGAAHGARAAWRYVPDACTAGPETRTSGDSSSGTHG